MGRWVRAGFLAFVLSGCLSAPPDLDNELGFAQEADLLRVAAMMGDASDVPRREGYVAERLVSGFEPLTQAVSLQDGTGRLLVVERVGRIHVMREDGGERALVANLTHLVSSGDGERGLLSVAVPPDFHISRKLFVTYTELGGDSVVGAVDLRRLDAEQRPMGGPHVLLRVEQPSPIHNVNHVLFGPDRRLYVAAGDGGGTPEAAQDLSLLRGSILRLHIEPDHSYSIPFTNPFVQRADARPEIWAYGLRNPWRIAFDAATGAWWIPDVGEHRWEEINHKPPGSWGGQNFGWGNYEGPDLRPGAEPIEDAVAPAWAYTHEASRCAIIGGAVYRGDRLPDLHGAFLFADWCAGMLGALRHADDEWSFLLIDNVRLPGVTSIDLDEWGEPILVDDKGDVWRLEAAP